MRGQWFIDGTWQPLEEDEGNLIEQEHLNCFRGQQMHDTFDLEVVKPVVDHKDGERHSPLPLSLRNVCIHRKELGWLGQTREPNGRDLANQ